MIKNIEKEINLIILSAPSISSSDYKKHFKDIISFQKDLVEKVLTQTNDKILVYSDENTYEKISIEFPANILRKFDFKDIWIRDFSMPNDELHFKYSTSYDNEQEASEKWVEFAQKTKISFQNIDYQLDGGNVVHNRKDKLIVSRKFLEDNKIKNDEEGYVILQSLFKSFKYFAIIPYDEDVLGHCDGMLSFIDENVLLMVKYQEGESCLKEAKTILTKNFKGVKILEVETEYSMKKYQEFYSASGCYANILVTEENVYVPVFGLKYDSQAIKTIKENTHKNVISIDCSQVCILGGNIRCLTWEVAGENAKRIIASNI